MRKRTRIVGRDDENSGNWEWQKPLTDYWTVLDISKECESNGMRLPMPALLEYMRARGIPLPRIRASRSWSTGDLLACILEPYLSTDVARFDADMPGFSGSAAVAVLTLGHTRDVRRRLRIAQKFLETWSASSGLNKRVEIADQRRDAERRESESRKAREHAAMVLREEERKLAAADAVARWEEQLHAEVSNALKQRGSDPYCRLNFLVHEGVVFFLQRGWWHTLPGNPHNVAAALEAHGVPLVRLAVTRTGFGHIPYFGRRHAEEPCVGWGERSLEVEEPAPGLAAKLAQARSLLRR